ncbi:MAG: tetratricopeptide repeat protein [bacterium]
MNRAIAIFLFVVCLSFPAGARAGVAFAECANKDDEAIAAKAMEGQGKIFERRYVEAKAIFEALAREYPDSPAGDFGLMATAEVQMLEREDFHLENEFLAAAKDGIKRVNGIMQCYHPSSWQLFLSGSLMGLDGFFKARKDQWWDAYVAGGKSRQLFRRVKEMDPKFMDADFGLGMYLYWRSVFTRDLWFLHMFPDKRAEGISIVERVAREGSFARDLARVNLVIMYFEERRFPDAKRLLDEYLARYPNNVIFKRLMGKTMIALKQYDAAVNHFRGIIAIDPAITQPHFFIGVALVLKGDPSKFDEAEKELNEFIRLQQGGRYWPAYAHYWLGRLAELKGDKEKAANEYKAAVLLEPKIQDAVKRIRGLGGGV